MTDILSDYLPIILFLGLSGVLALVLMVLPLLIAPYRPDPEKLSAYECGFNAFDDARMKFDVRFYLVAILFIIFDLEVTFIDPLLGFGFYIIDYYNPSGVNPGLLKAWDGPNGTGTLLGSFSTAQYDFQYNNKYFVGVTDSDRRIKSVTFGLPGGAGDSVYFDDLQLASGIPEPATMLLAGLALGIVVYFDRRRNRDQQ